MSSLNPTAPTFVPSTSPPATEFDWESIAPTAEEEEELNACDAWVAALVDAEIADEQQEAFHLESEQRSSTAVSPLASAVSPLASAVSVH